MHFINLHNSVTFVRHIEREMYVLWTFLAEEGVGPTNNFAERMIPFAVLWRKRSQGTNSDKGCRWVERILSLRQTCRLQDKSTYTVLVGSLDSYFKEQKLDLEWIRSAGVAKHPVIGYQLSMVVKLTWRITPST